MPKIERFEDLIAWQKARVLTKRVYEATRVTPFAKDFGLSGQIQRAAVSIMSNLAEGFERVAGESSTSFYPRLRLLVQNFALSYMSHLMLVIWIATSSDLCWPKPQRLPELLAA